MAKEIPGLHPQMPFNQAAALVIDAKLDEMFGHEAGARAGDDIEQVHDMRVASRRMRAAMDVFEDCFPRRTYKPLRKTAATLTRALGAVRDLDVMLEFLKRYRKDLPDDERPGIDDLVATLRAERTVARVEMMQALDEASRVNFQHRLKTLLKAEAH
jgi:CHAD domain-containing protein